MNRTYSGHVDDRKREDISLHKDAASRIEALYKSLGKSLTPNDDKSIMKNCYHWVDSDGNKIQVISARTQGSENGPALVVENRGIKRYGKNSPKGYHMLGRIRGSQADVIFFVLYLEDLTVRIVEINPKILIDYLDRFSNAQRAMSKYPEDPSMNAKKRAIDNWNSAFKIDSKGKIRIITPITVHELIRLSNKTSLLQINDLTANPFTHSFRDDSSEDTDTLSVDKSQTIAESPVTPKKTKKVKAATVPVAPMTFSINIESGDTKFGTSGIPIDKIRKIVDILIG